MTDVITVQMEQLTWPGKIANLARGFTLAKVATRFCAKPLFDRMIHHVSLYTVQCQDDMFQPGLQLIRTAW
ncbi:hypothetical protein [Pseudoalteromonas viridis]|uniref:Uncharacterized protein n=1 Tax=Pseudoalteromonas viridis TaxID=339617 RepID=A0ABX7VE66_9GAMM|nr:hypothetical protein [Pseudoalteromonas viridis]QTL37867.1 hypothetical protein J5X90_19180 [Pseudoalteromonas viridis]